MIVFTLKVKNVTDNRVIANLLDVAYLNEKDTLFIPDIKVQIEVTFEDTEKNEFRQIGYWALIQSLLFASISAKLLTQTIDGYPPRFIWYKRMDFSKTEQNAIRNYNLIMPLGENAEHVIGQHFVIDPGTMLKLYLYPQEQYFVQFEMISPGNWEHVSNLPDAFFKI